MGTVGRDMEWWIWFWIIPVILFTGMFLRFFAYTPLAPAPAHAQAPATDQAPERIYKPESWCFIGENTLGRYCVQNDTCGHLDRFPSRETCEYTEASALPLGLTGEGGLYHTPFMTPRNRHYTTF